MLLVHDLEDPMRRARTARPTPRSWSAALTLMAVTATGLASAVALAPSAAANTACEGATPFAAAGMVVCEQRFVGNGTWQVPAGVTTADVVVVGGGGGGSGSNASAFLAGNGGGGGHVTVQTKMQVAGAVSVTVGGGGRGGAGDTSGADANGQDGKPSTFGGMTAVGGTGGEGNGSSTLGHGGSSGRSVDGDGSSFGVGGVAVRQQFSSTGSPGIKGGGGWGAGGPGAGVGGLNRAGVISINAVQSTPSQAQAGMGGNGYRPEAGLFAFNFSSYLGGGGGGGVAVSSGTDGFGGAGGGGLGGWSSNVTDAAANTGGGGGGAGLRNRVGFPVETKPSGNGASGVIIVRWVAPPAITTAKLTTAVADDPFAQQLVGTGAQTLTWAITAGELPTGLTMTQGGLISGTPGIVESTSIDLTVVLTDAYGREVTKTLTMLALLPLEIETSTLPQGSADEMYEPTTLTASGGFGDLKWSATGLPAGMTLSSTGELSGTPSVSGAFDVVVTVTDGAGRSTKRTISFGIGVTAPLEVTASVGSAVEGAPFEAVLQATGGLEPYSWTVSSGALPAGVTLSPSGEISGTPTASGTFPVTATVTDSAGKTTSVDFELAVQPAEIDAQDVPICHRTDDGYELITVTDAVFAGRGEHGDHSGDIVPDLLGVGGGRNWGPEGMALFFNGCQPVDEALLDTDTDGLPDVVDPDDDGDGLVDVADPDADGDGITNQQDPDAVPVADQDKDGVPDALDPDDDGDCILDSVDKDRDGDGIPNATDTDIDNDGLPNAVDVDADGDGVANIVDVDGDGNGVASSIGDDTENTSRSVPSAKGVCSFDKDPDGDGLPTAQDRDDDGDGLPDAVDTPAPRPWVDTDADGVPNAQDADIDNDGVLNVGDTDIDGDGVPDARDVDDDGDGLADARMKAGAGSAVRPSRATTTVAFAPMDDQLTAVGMAQLRDLLKKVGRSPSTVVSIGYVQKSGTSANDQQLSAARARAAAGYLASLGVKSVYTVRGDGTGGSGPDARKVVVTVVSRG